jgi:hypothetical protein
VAIGFDDERSAPDLKGFSLFGEYWRTTGSKLAPM